jgi:hypothetical protein
MTYCPRFIHTLYCDDVRQEVGGKMTFVGAYQRQMQAEQPGELILPKLCIVITAQTPHEQPFKKLKIKLLRDDDVLQEVELPVEENTPPMITNGKPTKFDQFGVILTLTNMKFEESATLRIRVETEGEELWAPGFQILLKDSIVPS